MCDPNFRYGNRTVRYTDDGTDYVLVEELINGERVGPLKSISRFATARSFLPTDSTVLDGQGREIPWRHPKGD